MNIKKISMLLLAITALWSCNEPSPFDILNPGQDIDSDARLAVVGSADLWIDLNGAQTTFRLTGVDLQDISSVSINVVLVTQNEDMENIATLPVALEEISNPSMLSDTIEFVFTSSEFLAALGVNASDVVPGNAFNVVFEKTINGKTVIDRAFHKVLVSCPTNIPLGTWTLKGSTSTTELSYDGAGVYSLTELQFGYYNPAYGDIPGKFLDVCDDLTLLGSTEGTAYGIAWAGTGSYDADAGEMSFTYYDATYCGPDCVASVTLLAP